MVSTSWNDEEHRALRGMPMLAQLIYLKVFRRRMNYATGIAGGPGRKISTDTIIDEVGFVPDPGSHEPRWVPTRNQVRAAIAALERQRQYELDGPWICLLIDAGSDRVKGYVKKLPLATTDSSVRNMNHPGTTQEPPKTNHPGTTQDLDSKNNDLSLKGTQTNNPEKTDDFSCCTARNNQPPVSGIPEEKNTPLTPQSFALPESVDRLAWEEYEQHRREIRKPMTDLARRKAAAVLEGMTVEQQRASVDATIANRWTGLFPPKSGVNNNSVNGAPTQPSPSLARKTNLQELLS